jgi:CRISPR-associated helicase Cas3/CRISPR-associated endonuclease Cas3-HD
MTIYAHTKRDSFGNNLPKEQWQTLDDHLTSVAELAGDFAADIGAKDLAYTAGLLHDVGKATEKFQDRLCGSREQADHKTYGAQIALQRYKNLGNILPYVIAGHHNGLPDWASENAHKGLKEMLAFPQQPLLCDPPTTKENIFPAQQSQAVCADYQSFYLTMLIRIVFSCLVDADYLDTERFVNEEQSAERQSDTNKNIDLLATLFEPKLRKLLSHTLDSKTNISRNIVLKDCLAAADLPQGLFSLTVPTGGGKTLSSLAFAIKHAQKHNKKRIIYAIPFTSITEQNADVFREIFGENNLLEHHSNRGDSESRQARLAAENWDAPLVVTTNVQLLESLFAAKTSRARKVHNIANSVIILDEAQTMPDHLLRPTLAALGTLARDFGTTVVFCTATQPALHPNLLDGIIPTEIIQDKNKLFNSLSRVSITNLGDISDEALAAKLVENEQTLCIVNTRKHARKIFDLLPKDKDYIHLSALMCPVHRTKVITEIKRRLKDDERCVVVSTSLIEAGVDIDFPTVYRSVAGLDSIAQAAGRCNREGKKAHGDVFVFKPENGLPKGHFANMAQFAEETMRVHNNPLLPEAIAKFFNLRYNLGRDLDEKKILESITDAAKRMAFQFKEIEKDYQLIESDTIGIAVPYDDKAKALIAELSTTRFPREILRKLQRYTVSVYNYEFDKLKQNGALKQPIEGAYALAVDNNSYGNFYSEKFGLDVDGKYEALIM